MKVGEFIKKNGPQKIISVKPTDTVISAIRIFSDHDVSSTLVISNNSVVGVFSEGDYARNIILKGRSSKNTLICDVMCDKIIYVTPEYGLKQCLAIMALQKVNHIPVFNNNENLLAFISMKDAATALLEEKEDLVIELTRYITGSYASSLHSAKDLQPLFRTTHSSY